MRTCPRTRRPRFVPRFGLVAACLFGGTAAAAAAPQPGETVLWYRQPAATWIESLPLGNGMIGVRVFGGASEERIALNESTFWSGRPHDYANPEAAAHYPQIRDLVLAGRFREAERLADRHFLGRPAAQQAYQPLGNLVLSCPGATVGDDYRRALDLETGIATIRHRAGDATITREVFVSWPDRVLVVRVSGDRPGSVSLVARLESHFRDAVNAREGDLVMDGRWRGPLAPAAGGSLIAPVAGDGLRFRVHLRAIPEGGRCAATGDAVHVDDADAVTLILAAATGFVNYRDIGGDPAAACDRVLAAAPREPASLRRRHVDDFSGLMGRVRLDVGDPALATTPTDRRLAAVRAGAADPGLEALCFQFGRYLLAASSRPGGQPANLQGLWNEKLVPMWGSKYTVNINTQMNYWPAEVCNLPECHEPLFAMLADIAATGAETARGFYGIAGWVTHHNVDLWRGTAPVDAARYGLWPVGGAWLCRHPWEHFEFGGDRRFLERHYPILRESARFLLDLLVEDPGSGYLVTPVSLSPEHGYLDAAGERCFLSPGPTLDVAIIRDLFGNCIEAGRQLDVDADFRARLAAALDRLPPYRINSRGHLQEWIVDWPRAALHGHDISPVFTVFPGRSLTLRGTPELAAAVARFQDDTPRAAGWPAAWQMGVWARLEQGDRVERCLQSLLRKSLAPSLCNQGENQVDANLGLAAGVAEALIQSHAGEISLLPALPPGWRDGAVSGLRARGGFEVCMRWRDGRLTAAEIRGGAAGTRRIRSGGTTADVVVGGGAPVLLDGDLRPAATPGCPAAVGGPR